MGRNYSSTSGTITIGYPHGKEKRMIEFFIPVQRLPRTTSFPTQKLAPNPSDT